MKYKQERWPHLLTCLCTLILTQSALGPSSTIGGSNPPTPSNFGTFTGRLIESCCFILLFPVLTTAEMLGGLSSCSRGLPLARTAFTALSSTVVVPFLLSPFPPAWFRQIIMCFSISKMHKVIWIHYRSPKELSIWRWICYKRIPSQTAYLKYMHVGSSWAPPNKEASKVVNWSHMSGSCSLSPCFYCQNSAPNNQNVLQVPLRVQSFLCCGH